MKTRLLSLAGVLFLLAGCAAPADDDGSDSAQGAASNGGATSGSSLEGAMQVVLDGHTVSFDYALSSVDLTKQTAVWNAHITDRGGNTKASDDVNVVGKLKDMMRCSGCYTAEFPGGPSGLLATVTVSAGKVASIKYEGVDAKLVNKASTSGSSPSGGAPTDTGACTLKTSTSTSCKQTTRDQCQVGPLYPAQRGMMTFSFEKGGTCKP